VEGVGVPAERGVAPWGKAFFNTMMPTTTAATRMIALSVEVPKER
jgi:hypothetical protein